MSARKKEYGVTMKSLRDTLSGWKADEIENIIICSNNRVLIELRGSMIYNLNPNSNVRYWVAYDELAMWRQGEINKNGMLELIYERSNEYFEGVKNV